MTRSRLAGAVARGIVLVAGLGVGAWVVSNHTAELSGAADALANPRWPVVAIAVVAEAASISSFASLQAALFGAAGTPVRFRSLVPITLGGNAVANTLPGGAAFATAFAYSEFRDLGATDVVSAWVVFVVAVVSGVALGLIAAVGGLIAIDQAQSLDLTQGLLLALLVVVMTLVAAGFRARLFRVARAVARFSSRLVGRRANSDTVDRWVTQLAEIRPSRRDWAVVFSFATANWLLDCACLVLGFLAVRAPVPWRAILLAYGAGQLAVNLPITPGGLGVVEGSLTVALVAFGGARTSTVAAVLFYRIISFWGLLAAGWPAAVMLFLRRRKKEGL